MIAALPIYTVLRQLLVYYSALGKSSYSTIKYYYSLRSTANLFSWSKKLIFVLKSTMILVPSTTKDERQEQLPKNRSAPRLLVEHHHRHVLLAAVSSESRHLVVLVYYYYLPEQAVRMVPGPIFRHASWKRVLPNFTRFGFFKQPLQINNLGFNTSVVQRSTTGTSKWVLLLVSPAKNWVWPFWLFDMCVHCCSSVLISHFM